MPFFFCAKTKETEKNTEAHLTKQGQYKGYLKSVREGRSGDKLGHWITWEGQLIYVKQGQIHGYQSRVRVGRGSDEKG